MPVAAPPTLPKVLPDLFEVLRGQAHPGGGDEFLDVALVETDAVGAADAVHHLDLQGDDGHGRPGLRQQFQRAVEQAVVEDGLVQLRVARPGLRCDHRSRRGGLGKLDDGVGFALDQFRRRRIEPEQGLQLVQKAAFRNAQVAIGLAHAHCHLVGKLALAGIRQLGGSGFQAEALEQHVLIDPGQVGRTRLPGQGIGDTADFVALAVVLLAVGESGEQGDGQEGVLLFRVHIIHSSHTWVISRPAATRATRAQPRRST